jgi:hypothetical protein
VAFSETWTNRCLGEPSRITWVKEQRLAAVAAATFALDGAVAIPSVDAPPYAQERRFQLEWTIARAGLAMGLDTAATTAVIDQAFASASAMTDESKRDRALLWAALDLEDYGNPSAAARFVAAFRDNDFPVEHSAREIPRLVARGDIAGARRALAKLPPSWGIRTDVEAWHDNPRWYGSVAAAACVALAAPGALTAPEIKTLLEDAESITAKVADEWRLNRELRSLALAWGRVGELERAIVVASRMPGTERADALVELIDLFGKDAKLPLDQIDSLARHALAATQSDPLVIGSADPADRADMKDFVAQVGLGEVVAAIARQQTARGDRAAAAKAIATIPENLSIRHKSALQLGCARILAGEQTIDDVLSTTPRDDLMIPNLIDAASDVGCVEVMQKLMRGHRLEQRLADNMLHRLIYAGRLDDAIALLRAEWDILSGVDRTERLDELLTSLARDGRASEGSTLFRSLPPETTDLIEERALVAGYRLVVALATSKNLAEAKTLRDSLAPRLSARQ